MPNSPIIEKRGSIYLWALLLIVVTFIVYLPSFGGELLWDDDTYLNPEKLLTLEGLYRIWFTTDIQQYFPLIHTDFWLEQQLWGLWPLPYHVGNTVLHALTGIAAWLVSKKLNLRGAWLIGMVFAVHPIHVESVAWITERKNILSALFYLLALYAYLDYEDKREGRDGGGKANVCYGLSLFLFLMALLSKIVVCTFPVILIVIRWMRGREINAGYLIRLVPFFILSIIFGLITKWWEANVVGAAGTEWHLRVTERLMVSGRAAWFYVWKMIFPVDFTFIYPRWDLSAASGAVWFFTLGVIAAVVILFVMRKKIGRAPLAAVLFFLITLSPMLGFLDIYFFRYSFVSDHFPYIASLGIFALAIGTVGWITSRAESARPILAAVVIIILCVISFRQTGKFSDDTTLWNDTLKKNPKAWIAHSNLGLISLNRGENKAALKYFLKADSIWSKADEVHNNLGGVYSRMGLFDKAEFHYRRALKLSPGLAESLIGVSVVLSKGDREGYSEAYERGLRAAEGRPRSALIQGNFGNVLVRIGRPEEAVEYYKKALIVNPGYLDAHYNMGVALKQLGRHEEAESHFRLAGGQ